MTSVLAILAKGSRVNPHHGEKHLTLEELAEREGVAIQTVYHWNKTGTGPRLLKVGNLCRYRMADVLAWEESRLVGKSA